MIPVELYTTVYFAVISFLILFALLPLLRKPLEEYPSLDYNILSTLFLISIVAFIGLRDPWGDWRFFGDTASYTRSFNEIQYTVIETAKDVGFYLLMRLLATFKSVELFYVACALLYVLPLYFAFKKWFPRYALFAFIIAVSTFSFWAFGINGVRNGLATSLFIYALSFDKTNWKKILLFGLAVSFHLSLLLPLLAYLLAIFKPKVKPILLIWLLLIPIAYFFGNNLELNISAFFEAIGIKDNRADVYFADELDGQTVDRSFRLDFILFSATAVWYGYYFIVKKQLNDVFFRVVWSMYTITNAVWILLIYAPFTNRTAYLSWFLMPLIFAYPLLKDNNLGIKKNKWLAVVISLSLTFTLMLEFVL